MSWLTELITKAKEHMLSLVVSLVVLLLGAVWAAVPSEIWGKVSAATPKRALWSAIGLLVLGLFLESAYLVELRRKNKNKMTARFGVYWDRELTPHCPGCSKVLAYIKHPNTNALSGTWGFKCVQCSDFIPLNDDDGQRIEIADAKRLLSGGKIEAPELDDTAMEILKLLAEPNSKFTAEDLAAILGLHPQRMSHYLTNLSRQKYIYASTGWAVPSGPTTYRLNDKGRELLMSKNVI